MWLIAGAFTLFIVVIGGLGGGWETWAVRFKPDWTITAFIKRRTHLAIVLTLGLLVVAMLFGYTLGVGGH